MTRMPTSTKQWGQLQIAARYLKQRKMESDATLLQMLDTLYPLHYQEKGRSRREFVEYCRKAYRDYLAERHQEYVESEEWDKCAEGWISQSQ